MPISTSCWRRRLGRIGSVWAAAARITLGITVGMLVGVIAPGAIAAYATPSHGSATAPAAHGVGGLGVHGNAPSGSAAAPAPVQVQQSSTSALSASSAGSSAFSLVNSKGKGGTVHAASLLRNDGSGGISVPGNCQSPQCEAVELALAAVIGSPTTTPTTAAPAPTTTIAPPRAPARPGSLSLARATRTTGRAGSVTRAASPNPAHANPVPSVLDEPIQLASGGWGGVSLQAATNLRIPILFGAAVLLFVLLQALVDRRDPKMTRAPERGEDDSVGFS